MGNKLIKQDEIKKFYTLGEKLGSGSFATVYRATKKTDKTQYAVKVIKKGNLKQDELAVLQDEVDILNKIKHPNVVQLMEMYENKNKMFMVLELLEGGELFDSILAKGSYSEKEASEVTRSVVDAIKYLHGVGVVHRDLKPENLMYAHKHHSVNEPHNVKITDFGLAKHLKSTGTNAGGMTTACGTPGYVAPEVLNNTAYGPQVDMWSIGVILYILLCGFPPFYNQSTAALYRQIKRGEFDFPKPYWDDISDNAKNLVCGLLTVDAKKRLTPDQVLAHPWISSGTASSKAIGGHHGKLLELMQARKVLRHGVQSIIAVNRFSRQLSKLVQKGKK